MLVHPNRGVIRHDLFLGGLAFLDNLVPETSNRRQRGSVVRRYQAPLQVSGPGPARRQNLSPASGPSLTFKPLVEGPQPVPGAAARGDAAHWDRRPNSCDFHEV